MAFTKEHKGNMLADYQQWLRQSQAIFVLEYNHMAMKDVDGLRAKVREAGGRAHVVKNTLMEIALKETGYGEHQVVGKSLYCFAGTDAAALAKALTDATKNSEIFKVKGGFLGTQAIKPAQVKALADLPALPVMRAILLGTINAPASKVVRTLAEPARQVAAVVKSYSEKDAAPAAA